MKKLILLLVFLFAFGTAVQNADAGCGLFGRRDRPVLSFLSRPFRAFRNRRANGRRSLLRVFSAPVRLLTDEDRKGPDEGIPPESLVEEGEFIVVASVGIPAEKF